MVFCSLNRASAEVSRNAPLRKSRLLPARTKTAIQSVYWENDWPYITGGNFPKRKSHSHSCPNIRKQNQALMILKRRRWHQCFKPCGFLSEEIGSLTARPGYLRLYGRESFNSLFHQALVARRWSDFRFRSNDCRRIFTDLVSTVSRHDELL